MMNDGSVIDGLYQAYCVDIACNAFGHALGVLHGVYYCCRAVGDIATGEYSLAGGHAIGGVAGEYVAFAVIMWYSGSSTVRCPPCG